MPKKEEEVGSCRVCGMQYYHHADRETESDGDNDYEVEWNVTHDDNLIAIMTEEGSS